MDAKFKDIGMKAVFADTSKGGLFLEFNKDYKKSFGKNINVSCPKCRVEAWEKYLKSFEMSKSGNYELKAKYNGIQLGFNGKPLRNGEFTDAEAKKLIKDHPKGEGLFSKVPEKKATKKATKKDK